MRFEGNPEVLRNLWRKKHLIETGDTSQYHYRTLVLACTGVIRGVYGVGQAFALHERQLGTAFDSMIGVSTGTPTLAYLLTGQERQSIYWKEAVSNDFMSWRRWLSRKGPFADIDYICRVFGDIDQSAVRSSRPGFYAGATDVDTGRPVFLDVKNDHTDLVEVIRASIAIPGLADPVLVGGQWCVDGATAMTFPVQQVIERFAPTDLLVLANRSGFTRKTAVIDRLTSMVTMQKLPIELQRAHFGRYKKAQQELEYLRSQDSCRYAILWSDGEVDRFERDSSKVEAAFVRSRSHLAALLDETKRQVEIEHAEALAAE